MAKLNPSSFISYLLPFLSAAGAYSRQIQARTIAHASKGGKTIFHQALSDADLTVQSYLEVVLLAKFPELSFFSEEQAQSLNAKYFAKNADYEVALDPIDGTRSYLDNRKSYQIIVTLHDRKNIVAVICHAPRLGKCYFAIRGKGAFVLPTNANAGRTKPKRVRIKDASGPILLFDSPRVQAKLSRIHPTIDVLHEYQRSAVPLTFLDIFESKVSAQLHSPVQLIDGAALAFIAEEAGAIVTDFCGRPLKNFRRQQERKLPNLLVSATFEMHRRILDALK